MVRPPLAGGTVLIVLLTNATCSAFQLSPGGPRVSIRTQAVMGPPVSSEPAPNVLRVDSELILVPTRITTLAGASVTGMQRESFHVFEDGVEQRVSYFATDDAPISIGLLFD